MTVSHFQSSTPSTILAMAATWLSPKPTSNPFAPPGNWAMLDLVFGLIEGSVSAGVRAIADRRDDSVHRPRGETGVRSSTHRRMPPLVLLQHRIRDAVESASTRRPAQAIRRIAPIASRYS